METNLIAQGMVTQIERARLPMLAERGRLIEEALATQEPHPARLALRGWLGRVLNPNGQRALLTPRTSAIDPH